MIKVYATIASLGLVIAGGAGCSSANTPDDDESDGGSSSSTAGTNSSSGSGVIPMGGSTSNGGSGSDAGSGTTPTAGTSSTPTAGTGSGGAPPSAAACKGIKTGMACMPEGQACPDLACGLADSGTRSCTCEATWMCSSCDFTNSPFKDKPADITTCTNQADKLDCTGMDGAVCEGAPGGEVCACAADDEGALIWDCDKAPTTWAAPAM